MHSLRIAIALMAVIAFPFHTEPPEADASDMLLRYVLGAAGPPFNLVGEVDAAWMFEDDLLDGVGTFCSGACNLDNADWSDVYDGTNYKQGAKSADFDSTTDFMVSEATEFDVSGTGTSVTWGCWIRPVENQKGTIISKEDGSNDGYFMERRIGPTKIACKVDNSVDQSANGSCANDAFCHAVCRYDGNVNDEIEAFVNGVGSGSPTGETTLGTAVTAPLTIGATSDNNAILFGGQMDECFVVYKALDAASICWIHACGLDGTKCACNSGTPANYDNYGDNTDATTPCALPACNIAAFTEVS